MAGMIEVRAWNSAPIDAFPEISLAESFARFRHSREI
jgi:hypothetical protein